jgi:hypothetical protein
MAERTKMDLTKKALAFLGTNRETTDREIARWGADFIPDFLGVCPRAAIPDLVGKKIEPGSSFVLNLDFGDYSRGGTHWTGAYFTKEEPLQCLYFDSFGMPPPRDLTLRCMSERVPVWYSDVQYQAADEENCGPRALAALYCLATAPDDLEEYKELCTEESDGEGLTDED